MRIELVNTPANYNTRVVVSMCQHITAHRVHDMQAAQRQVTYITRLLVEHDETAVALVENAGQLLV